jgi:ferredoxin
MAQALLCIRAETASEEDAMAIRKIVHIDEEKCDGCGNCVPACHEGALQIVDGKARLVRDVYCDGLGDCLGECPQDAISIEEREAADFDPQAVEQHLRAAEQTERTERTERIERTERAARAAGSAPPLQPAELQPMLQPRPGPAAPPAAGCPGAAMQRLRPEPGGPAAPAPAPGGASALAHWPLQIELVPVGAPFLRRADILICADCVPFAVPDFHARYLDGRSVLVGCPKLDDLERYRSKLKDLFAAAEPRSLTVLRMEVPCCGGIAQAVLEARDAAAPELPVAITTVGIRGQAHTVEAPAAAAPSRMEAT